MQLVVLQRKCPSVFKDFSLVEKLQSTDSFLGVSFQIRILLFHIEEFFFTLSDPSDTASPKKKKK